MIIIPIIYNILSNRLAVPDIVFLAIYRALLIIGIVVKQSYKKDEIVSQCTTE